MDSKTAKKSTKKQNNKNNNNNTMNNTTPVNRRRHAPRRVICIDSDGSETEGLSDHNGSRSGSLSGSRAHTHSRGQTQSNGRIQATGHIQSHGRIHTASGYTGSDHSSSDLPGSGHSGSGHVLSGSNDTRAISGPSPHTQPRTNTGSVIGISGSEAAVRIIQSRLTETSEENQESN